MKSYKRVSFNKFQGKFFIQIVIKTKNNICQDFEIKMLNSWNTRNQIIILLRNH